MGGIFEVRSARTPPPPRPNRTRQLHRMYSYANQTNTYILSTFSKVINHAKPTARRRIRTLRGISPSKRCFWSQYSAQFRLGTRNGGASPPVIVLHFVVEDEPHLSCIYLVRSLTHELDDQKTIARTCEGTRSYVLVLIFGPVSITPARPEILAACRPQVIRVWRIVLQCEEAVLIFASMMVPRLSDK